ncbi:serine/threonine protein kinase, partial [Myxococcota bacterium]|nr:serine/threonine protein kinase [Myxococcota bacterium]
MTNIEDALIGKHIGSFKVLATLGEGAYGTVYQGVHPTIGRMVAIKVLNAAWSSDSSIVNRFIDEARSANSINHPNIIQIYDFGQLDDGRFFCIMEYIQGKELNEIIEERSGLELKYVEIILPQIVSALSAAHEAKVIHRDLKP